MASNHVREQPEKESVPAKCPLFAGGGGGQPKGFIRGPEPRQPVLKLDEHSDGSVTVLKGLEGHGEDNKHCRPGEKQLPSQEAQTKCAMWKSATGPTLL